MNEDLVLSRYVSVNYVVRLKRITKFRRSSVDALAIDSGAVIQFCFMLLSSCSLLLFATKSFVQLCSSSPPQSTLSSLIWNKTLLFPRFWNGYFNSPHPFALHNPGVLTLTFSSRADILSLRWSCSLSLDSERSLSTVSDRRLLCSSFIFSLCRACMKKGTTSLQQVKVVKLGRTAPHFYFLTLSSSWFFSSSWASSCLSLSSTLPWRSSAWKLHHKSLIPFCSIMVVPL